jgi:hypothetical protein
MVLGKKAARAWSGSDKRASAHAIMRQQKGAFGEPCGNLSVIRLNWSGTRRELGFHHGNDVAKLCRVARGALDQ